MFEHRHQSVTINWKRTTVFLRRKKSTKTEMILLLLLSTTTRSHRRAARRKNWCGLAHRYGHHRTPKWMRRKMMMTMEKHVCRFCGSDQTDAIASSVLILLLFSFFFWLLLFHEITSNSIHRKSIDVSGWQHGQWRDRAISKWQMSIFMEIIVLKNYTHLFEANDDETERKPDGLVWKWTKCLTGQCCIAANVENEIRWRVFSCSVCVHFRWNDETAYSATSWPKCSVNVTADRSLPSVDWIQLLIDDD